MHVVAASEQHLGVCTWLAGVCAASEQHLRVCRWVGVGGAASEQHLIVCKRAAGMSSSSGGEEGVMKYSVLQYRGGHEEQFLAVQLGMGVP